MCSWQENLYLMIKPLTIFLQIATQKCHDFMRLKDNFLNSLTHMRVGFFFIEMYCVLQVSLTPKSLNSPLYFPGKVRKVTITNVEKSLV